MTTVYSDSKVTITGDETNIYIKDNVKKFRIIQITSGALWIVQSIISFYNYGFANNWIAWILLVAGSLLIYFTNLFWFGISTEIQRSQITEVKIKRKLFNLALVSILYFGKTRNIGLFPFHDAIRIKSTIEKSV